MEERICQRSQVLMSSVLMIDGITDDRMDRRASEMATSVHGVLRHSSVLHLSSMCHVFHSVAVVTGTTASQHSAVMTRLMTARGGLTVVHVCSTLCVAGALSLTILPSAAATMAISPVFKHRWKSLITNCTCLVSSRFC